MIATHSTTNEQSHATRRGSVRTVLVVAVAAVLLAILGFSISDVVAHNTATYAAGNPATWLPSQQLHQPVDRLLVGTYSNPAITVAGGNVAIKTPSFSAMAVVTGPLVPGEGFLYQPQYVAATWTVHIWDVKGNIALSAADFDNLDHSGIEYHVLAAQGTTVPKSVSTGHQVTFQLRAVVPIGEDLFRWAPNGNNIIAKWDNQVEND